MASWTSRSLLLMQVLVVCLSGGLDFTSGQSRRRHHRDPTQREGRDHRKGELSRNLGEEGRSVFLSDNNTSLVAHRGSSTTLHCQVEKDSQHGVKWNLRMRNVELEDGGLYECQATTHPPQSIFVTLRVVAAYAEIVGTKDKVFNSGSRLQLICVLKLATSRPDYIFWYHNERMINFDKDRGVSVKEDDSGSTLTMTDVSVSDSGNYSCEPRDLRAAEVAVTILSERQAPDALQDKTTHTSSSTFLQPPLLGTVFFLYSFWIILKDA